MKKFLAVLTVLCLLQTVWPTLQSFPTAQTAVQGNSILATAKTVKPVAASVDLEAKDVEGLKEKDVTDYYKSNSNKVSKLLSTEKADNYFTNSFIF